MKVVGIPEARPICETLRPAWEELLRQFRFQHDLSDLGVDRTWWSAYGKSGATCESGCYATTGTSCAESLRCVSRTLRKIRPGRQALSFIGDGSNDSDYLDFIIERVTKRPCSKRSTTLDEVSAASSPCWL